MREKPNWQPARQGVMVYSVAPRVSVEETEHTLSQLSVTDDQSPSLETQASQVSDTVLPTCETSSEYHIKEEDVEVESYTVTRDSSPETLAGDDADEVFLEAISTALSTPESSTSVDFLAQLIAAAERECSVPISEAATPSPTLSEEYVHVGYDTDRTDFQETTPSPSIRFNQQERASAIRKGSQHSQRKARLLSKKPLARQLDFGMKVQKRPAKAAKRSANVQSLENLRSLERAPPHNWNNVERELLCVLNRWYHNTSRAEELLAFSKVFNRIANLELRPYIIRNQFEGHLRLYGSEAYPVYGRVFEIPFDDPEGRYAELRTLIEAEAETLQLNLRRRQSDLKVTSGTARYARSPRTRKAYKSLVQRASQETKKGTGRSLTIEDVTAPPAISMGRSRAVRAFSEDDWEIVTDVESSPKHLSEPPKKFKATSTRPHLVFRVWDAANRTRFIDGAFVAQAFLDWPRPFPAPIALNDPSNAGKILTLLHLSKQGDTPVYISTASSLLQALSYATTMQDPKIALIDLDAASLQAEHKLHHAADIFPWLKAQGLARWARYRGHGEYIVWSDIPSDAVLITLDLERLIGVLNNDEDCRQLLCFNAFEAGAKTSSIAASLRERSLTLNTTTARALGKVARHFGVAHNNVNLEHLQDFVARVMDGWTIQQPPSIDVHTMSTLAVNFATALGTHAGGFTLQEVMAAFMDGLDQGARCIAHWSRSRSGSRRQRFREA